MRKAQKPLNQDAVAAANRSVAQKYCPEPKPGDPNYGAFRKDWMDAYAGAGGAVLEMSKQENLEQIKKDRAAAKRPRANRGAVATCPLQDSDTSEPPKPLPPPPPPPPKQNPECPCKLTRLKIACSHDGRSARNNLLMVVADHALGDTISVTPEASGDCAQRLTVRADRMAGFPKTGASPSSFSLSGPTLASGRVFTLWNASPTSIFVSAEACGAALAPIKIDAYPGSKVAIKIDIKEMQEKYAGILAYLPIKTSGQRAPVRPLGAPKDKNWDPKKYGRSVSAEAQWKEDKGSNLAYCETALNGGFDPLIGTEASYPVYGVPVPPLVAKYVKFGIYLNIGLGLNFGATCTWAYWPHDDSTKWSAFKIELAGKLAIELAAELLVCSPDVIQTKASGKAEGVIKGWGEKEANKSVAVKAKGEINPLTVGLVFKLAWGLVEYERAWPIAPTIETDEFKHVFGE